MKVVIADRNYITFSAKIIEYFFYNHPELVKKVEKKLLDDLRDMKIKSGFPESECNIFHWAKIDGVYYSCKAESDDDKFRSDKRFIEAVEKTKDNKYCIIEIPDGVDYYINHGSGGDESIHEKHRKWS